MSKVFAGKGRDLPLGWRWTTMGDIAEVVGGGTPRTAEPANFEGGDIPWVTPADLSGYTEKYISHGSRYITHQGLESSSARLLPAGSVLFTSRAPIGYVAIARNPMATNQGFKSFLLRDGVSPEYVYWWLKGSKQLAESLASGTTFLEISGANAKKIPIPIAPLNQQHKIVAEIEKQFSRLDEAVANVKRVKANLKRYKAAVLKAAIEGRLIPTEEELAHCEVRSYETGGQRLAHILAERRSGWRGKGRYVESISPDTNNLPELPKGWTWATIDQISVVVRGASPRPAGDQRYFGGYIPWITVGPITCDGDVYLRSVPETVTEAGKERSRFIEPHTLLLTNSGATLGVPKIALIGGCINDGVAALLEVDYPTKLYLLYFLRTLTDKLRGINQGAAQPNLNTSIIKALVVPFPPVAEQHRIVAEIERRLSLVSEMEVQVDVNLQRANCFVQSILQQGFSGRER